MVCLVYYWRQIPRIWIDCISIFFIYSALNSFIRPACQSVIESASQSFVMGMSIGGCFFSRIIYSSSHWTDNRAPSCKPLHGQPRQSFEWNYFPLLTGRIVLLNKKKKFGKILRVVFLKHFQKKTGIRRTLDKWKKKQQ